VRQDQTDHRGPHAVLVATMIVTTIVIAAMAVTASPLRNGLTKRYSAPTIRRRGGFRGHYARPEALHLGKAAHNARARRLPMFASGSLASKIRR
jgi:hypothetical protein